MKSIVLKHLVIILSAVALWSSATVCAQSRVEGLRCEYLENPLGIDTPSPRFTWIVRATGEFTQSRRVIRVASSPELLQKNKPDVWSDDLKTSDNMAECSNAGLRSHTKYYWDVTVWDSRGRRSRSAIANFETAKMAKTDWQAQWISDGLDKSFRKAPLLRKNFETPSGKSIRSARAYICGTGYYELFINGQKAGDHYLDPGYTHFDRRVLYVTHDVTELLQSGANGIAVVLGNGWFNVQSLAVWKFDQARWRRRPQLICEVRVEYHDGSVEEIFTDSSWRTATGAYIYNNLYSGDTYDARLEVPGWKNAQFDDGKWKQAVIVSEPAPLLAAQCMPAIRAVREIVPVAEKRFEDNRIRVYDMGENFSGVCRLRVSGEAGTRITLKHAELLYDNGRVNQGNIDVYFQREKNDMPLHRDPTEVFQTDTYYLRGDGVEQFIPSFTYHGFRYVEMESDKPVRVESLTGLFLHTDVRSVGGFVCSNPVLNALVKAARQSYLSNLHSIPTDCPQREKNGWTADGYITMDLALLNFDAVCVYEKWLHDFADNQREQGDISGIIPSAGWGYADWIGPVWDAGMFIIPSTLYRYYGDKHPIEQIWPACEKYLKYLRTRETNGMLTYGIGDWVYYKAQTNTEFTSTAFYYYDNTLMADFALLLGKDPAAYRAKADTLKKLINSKFFNPSDFTYANGTQAAQAVALALGLVPAGSERQVADRLAGMLRANGHQLDFGMLGSKFVPAMLAKYGYEEDAYMMITNPKAPSWAQWMELGLTTLPETWVLSKDFKDASLNHPFLGDVCAWMVNTLAGIDSHNSAPAFRKIVIRPRFIKDLTWVKGEYESVQGMISSEWRRDAGKITLTVTIPANTTATVYAPHPVEKASGTHVFIIPEK